MNKVCIALALALTAPLALAQNVRITPIGSHPGELCANDRATIFEDPTGVRILYDVAHNLTGPDDSRVGDVDVVLLSHMHGDHLGDRRLRAVGAGTCANSERELVPHAMTAEVVLEKDAVLVTTRAMAGFVANEVREIRGESLPVCASPVAATVPVNAACSSSMDLGGRFVATAAGATNGVEITIVYASHVNNAPNSLLDEAQRALLQANGAQLELGPPTGYVVRFTNGLTAYLSGDTGIHSEMRTVINEYHDANLAVLNLGNNPGIYYSAAHVINELIQPASVILTHPNEAATENGRPRPQSHTARLIEEIDVPTHAALSGRTMEFDGRGRCVAGC
jgi:L-ascorbate metabolism protein UlaG (beta-lactamase superfamily)